MGYIKSQDKAADQSRAAESGKIEIEGYVLEKISGVYFVLKNIEDMDISSHEIEAKTISELAKSEEVFFNFSTGKFGYGDDGSDFSNAGEKYASVFEMDVEEDGSLTLLFEEEQLNMVRDGQ